MTNQEAASLARRIRAALGDNVRDENVSLTPLQRGGWGIRVHNDEWGLTIYSMAGFQQFIDMITNLLLAAARSE